MIMNFILTVHKTHHTNEVLLLFPWSNSSPVLCVCGGGGVGWGSYVPVGHKLLPIVNSSLSHLVVGFIRSACIWLLSVLASLADAVTIWFEDLQLQNVVTAKCCRSVFAAPHTPWAEVCSRKSQGQLCINRINFVALKLPLTAAASQLQVLQQQQLVSGPQIC